MISFNDANGRAIVLAINVTTIKRTQALTGIYLPSLLDDKFQALGALLADDVKLVDVIYAVCKSELDAAGISDEEFGRSMFGDAIERAANAFKTELVDFFRDPRVRAGLKKALAKIDAVYDQVLAHQQTKVDELDPSAVAAALIASSGNARASSASIPDPLPFVNYSSWPKLEDGPTGPTRPTSSA